MCEPLQLYFLFVGGEGPQVYPRSAAEFKESGALAFVVFDEQHILTDVEVQDAAETGVQYLSVSGGGNNGDVGFAGGDQYAFLVDDLLGIQPFGEYCVFEVEVLEGAILLYDCEAVG
jgi:hypothetical protein